MSNKSIVHIAPDEKFIEAAKYLYEKAFPVMNTFFIIKPAANPPLKYVKPGDNIKIRVSSVGLPDKIAGEIDSFDIVVFHGLNDEMVRIFEQSGDKDKFIWTFWGAEIYNSRIYPHPILGPKTRRLERELQKDTFLDLLKTLYRRVRYRNLYHSNPVNKKKAMQQFRYIARLNEDISVFKEAGLLREECNVIPFTYYPLEYLFPEHTTNGWVHGDHILLGNSASATNNHLEMIDRLSNMKFGNRKVITPLSYGKKKYARKVGKYGQEKLGESFVPLTEFMPLDAYHEQLRKCSIVIMNHYRPQGVGTILGALYMGAKVFLNDTPFFRYLQRIGCHVYLIEDELVNSKEKAFQALGLEQKRHNRNCLRNEIESGVMVNKMRKAFDEYFE